MMWIKYLFLKQGTLDSEESVKSYFEILITSKE